MESIIEKYGMYNVTFNEFSKKVIIRKKIPVKKYIALRREIKNLKIFIRDIVVEAE